MTQPHADASIPEVRPAVAAIVAVVEIWSRWAMGSWLLTPLAVGAVTIILLTIAPRPMAPLSVALWRLLHFVGRVNNTIVLALLFFLVITPIGVVQRAFRGGRIQVRQQAAADSYWVERPKDDSATDFRRMF